MVERLTLPAGTYQLHVAAREVQWRVRLGDLRSGRARSLDAGLTMTPLLVSGTRARQVPSVNRDDRVLRALGGSPPITSRVFRRDVELVTIVRDARDRDIVHSVRPNASDRADPGRSVPYAIDIPLRTLPAGRYLLRVEARAAGTPEPVVREVRFEVGAG